MKKMGHLLSENAEDGCKRCFFARCWFSQESLVKNLSLLPLMVCFQSASVIYFRIYSVNCTAEIMWLKHLLFWRFIFIPVHFSEASISWKYTFRMEWYGSIQISNLAVHHYWKKEVFFPADPEKINILLSGLWAESAYCVSVCACMRIWSGPQSEAWVVEKPVAGNERKGENRVSAFWLHEGFMMAQTSTSTSTCHVHPKLLHW